MAMAMRVKKAICKNRFPKVFQPMRQQKQATKKKKKLWPVLAAIAAVLAVAILAGVLLPGLIGGASGKDDRISERETESGKSEKQTAPSSDSDPAPAPDPDPEPADLLDLLLVEPGKLTVAVSPDFAPMEFVDPSKSGQERFVGLDMSFARFIASEMGLELVLMPMSFDGCQEAVYDGRVDMAISAFSWTAERDSIYSLSNAYSVDTEPNGLIVMATEASRFRTSEDLSNAVIAVQAGSLQESLCEAQLPNAKRIPVDTIEEGIALLKSGQVTAVADNTAHARYIIAEDPALAVSDFLFLDDGGNVILMKKGHTQLTARVNELIALAYEEDLFTAWMETAKNIDGIEVSYDDNGDPIN